ncbi:MAG: hypothetical protein AB8F94_25535 [Saprospiraceae bacterium]
MKFKNIFIYGLILLYSLNGHGQKEDENKWDFEKKYFIGSQAFILFTPLLDPSPEYFQLSFGYRFSPKDEISIEGITWAYQGPLGRPYGPNYENPDSGFPGDVKAIGGGIAYKRFLWKGAFAQIHSTALRQIYRDENKNKIQNGFQLFNTLRFGYHFKIFKKRWFISPSVAFTNWPINTNLPESFQIEEDKWSNYFLFEPGLQFGFAF